MKKRSITILGSTGSIGLNTVNVIKTNNHLFDVYVASSLCNLISQNIGAKNFGHHISDTKAFGNTCPAEIIFQINNLLECDLRHLENRCAPK